jgi:dihydroorotase
LQRFFIFAADMSTLIKNVVIADAQSVYNGKKVDVFIQKGTITAIGKNLNEKASRIIDNKDSYMGPGWVDMMADYCDPGYEHKEDITTGLEAAAAGGFSDVCIVPNTQPTLFTKSNIEYVLQKSKGNKVDLHPLAAVTHQVEGKNLAEMMDMHHAGAVAFTDGWQPIQNAGLMLKALEYVKAFGGTIIQIPVMASLSSGGLMNEGKMSMQLGMSGIPNIAESLLIQRDIELARYTQSKIHFAGITTPESIALIKNAKKEGLAVTCSVTPYHLLYSDENLQSYNSFYKVAPPLRTEAERKILIKALTDGIIDVVATHHQPQDWDGKFTEFEYAKYGIISQETCWPMLLRAAPKMSMEQWTQVLSTKPREILGLAPITVQEGAPAKFTLFDTHTEWIYTAQHKKSKAINSTELNIPLIGKAHLIA